ncbi:MAG: hypothetical protein ACO1O6_05875 [Bacteroidota bacterium]
MKLRVLIFCLFVTGLFLGQDSLLKGTIGIRFNRLDLFEENSLILEKEKLAHEFGLGFGINRTIFQQRVFPEMFYGLQTRFQTFGALSCQGMANYYLSCFQANRDQSEIHFFNELLLGAHVRFGRKYAFFFQPQIGLQSESFHSDFFKRTENGFSFAYSAKIGFSHAF